MGCGAGTGSLARKKLAAQHRIFCKVCPILQCAVDRHVRFCLEDCLAFPCRAFEQGPAPFSAGFLEMQKRMRRSTRPPSMNLANMSAWAVDELDPSYWRALMDSDPEQVCRTSGASFLKNEEAYRIHFLGCTYHLYPFRRHAARVVSAGGRRRRRLEHISLGEAVILLNYLLRAKDTPITSKWVTERDLPGGLTFFQGPHHLTRGPVLARYGSDPEGLVSAGVALGGRPIQHGDAAIHLEVLRRIPLRYILWEADEEFPAHLTILFDASITEYLNLDAVWTLVHIASTRLAAVGCRQRVSSHRLDARGGHLAGS